MGQGKEQRVTQKMLFEIFHYDPGTGLFTRKITTGPTGKAGDVLGKKVHKGERYVRLSVNGRRYYAAKLAWLYVYGRWQTHLTYRNCDVTDNRIDNIVRSNRSQSAGHAKIHKNNKVGAKGVTYCKIRNKYRATITVHRKTKHLGYFDTLRNAHLAYCSAAEKAFGQFAMGAC